MTSDIPTPEACDLVEPLQFEPHYPPLADFFISTNTDRRIRRLMSRLGATAVRRRDHDVYLWGFPEGQHLFAGFGVIDGRLAKGPVSLRAAPATLGVGSYVLIDLSSGTTAVSADPGGNHVLYHGLGTVTNRLHLAALVHQLINYSSALSTAHSNHMFCQQFGTLSTPIAGISITLPGDRLRVRERVELDRDSMDDFSPLTPDEYRDFIAKGAADLIENVTAIVKGPYPVLCDITGGQDSRVVLGALVAAGLTKEVVFHTRFSEDAAILTATVNNREAIRRKRADLEIGAALVNHFGGSFEPRPTPDGYQPTSVAESLRLRRSQRFGSYHFMNGQILSQRRPVRKVPYIRLSGGSGELYREYYQRYFTAVDPSAQFSGPTVSRMLTAKYNPALPASILDRFIPHFADTFARLPGLTMGQRLDSHYRTFRNRFHFGVNASNRGGHLSISPLGSPALLRAAAGLPEHEKATGRVLFDVTRVLCEILPYFPYDKQKHPFWADSAYHFPSRFDSAPPTLKPGEIPKQSPARPSDQSRFHNLCVGIMRSCLPILRSTRGPFSELCTISFEDYLMTEVSRRPTRLASWSSRLQAFVDYLSVSEVV